MRIACSLIVVSSLVIGCSDDSSTAPSDSSLRIAPGSQRTDAATSPAASEDVSVEAGDDDAIALTDGAPAADSAKSAAGDWRTWRGPSLNGIANSDEQPPTSWSDSRNVVWKSSVPGRGHSSPTVVGKLVVLATADKSRQIQSVIAYDRTTGDELWKTDVNTGAFPAKLHPKNTHASPTVVSNGSYLFASFANHDSLQVTALDMEGNQVWQEAVGAFRPKQYEYGYAPSPTLYGSTLIVASEFETGSGGYLAALDQKTGDTVWMTPRFKQITFSSPVVANVAGRDQVLISGADHVASYDPNTGVELWKVRGTTKATCGTIVWEGDFVFASGGYPKAETLCVNADGSGNVMWRNNQKCYEQSMLVSDGFLYGVTDKGIAYCWKASDGTEMWKERLAGPVSASPVLVAGNIVQSNEKGTTWVFEATGDGYQELARNQLGDEAFASPAVSGDQLFLRVADSSSGRRQESLYCIGAGN